MMKLCWTFKSIPELGFISDKQRSELLISRVPRGTSVGLWANSVFVGILIGGLSSSLIELDLWLRAFWIAIVGIVIAVIWFQFQMLRVRVHIRLILLDQFQDEQVPVCLKCGYNLEGSKSIKCPECGASTFVPKKEINSL